MIPITIGITGGTGFIGRHLADQLSALGHKIIILSRSPGSAKSPYVSYAGWDPKARQIDRQALSRLDALINLAGAAVVEKRWTPARKAEIISSRVDATLFLHEEVASHAPKCRTFLAAAATGYYGPDRQGLVPFDEEAGPYHDFLADVCKRWEEATFAARGQYDTCVAFRTGIVLGSDGGAYPELAGPMHWGVVPILGSGRQIVSWIHIDDLVGLYIDALFSKKYQGVYNAVAPAPVSHRMLMQTIARAKGGIKIPAPVPAFILRLLIGEASVEVLKSCTVSSSRVEALGFKFLFPTIETAIRSIVEKEKDYKKAP